MKQDSCITDIDKLRKWFFLNQTTEEKKPFFTIYRGAESKPDRVIYRNLEISDVEDAWEAMQEIIEMHSEHGGIFRVFITIKPMFNNGMTTLFKAATPFPQYPSHPGAGIAGMYGGMYGNPNDLVEKELAKAKQIWDLEQQIKDIRAESEAKVGEMDNMLQEFMPIIKDLGHRFGLKMMGFGGAPAMPAPSPQMGNQNTDELPEYDYERLEPALDQLREVIPDVETNIEKLANWARQNPDLARQMLNNL